MKIIAAFFAILAIAGAVCISVPAARDWWLTLMAVGIIGFAVFRMLAWAVSK